MSEERRRRLVWLWLPVLIWMAVIFYASSQPSLPTNSSGNLDFIIKKTAHVITYAILGVLGLRAWRGTLALTSAAKAPAGAGWLKSSIPTVLFGSLYAASDELHQRLVPPRHGQINDVILDTAAVTLGVLVVWLWQRLRSRRQD